MKYLPFLIKRYKDSYKRLSKNIITNGSVKIVYTYPGIKVFWNDTEVTKNVGLNTAINILGMWTDSSQADWQVLEKGKDYLMLKNRWSELPVTQVWRIELQEENQIHWQVEMEAEEDLWIDEGRVVILLSEGYKSWVSSYEQGRFSRITKFQEAHLNNSSSCFIGVRSFRKEQPLPSLLLEFIQNDFGKTHPLIQNSSADINARLLGVIMSTDEDKKYHLPGNYKFFSGKIILSADDEPLDRKIEGFRKIHFKGINEPLPIKKRERKLKVLLVNLPWQREGRWGVRAGSRWPHIKDRSEGNYLPFPFFLAYATSLLQKHNINACIIDAIAEQIPEDTLMERILGMDFDYLVAETSIPSFYDDLRMLERIHKAGIPIILCGPNSEIYKLQFLKEHLFIDFVLYGEYELSLLELIKSLQENGDLSKVKGLIYRRDKEVIKNPKQSPFDINLLPWPNREQLPMDKYWDLPGDIPFPSLQMLASRGCPFGCNFCLWPQVLYQNNLYKVRDVKDVVDEMEYLVKQKGFKSVYFDDDTFNIGKERMLRFCQVIKERSLQNIPWAIMARPDLMDDEILTEMKSAGLRAVKYGVESIFERLLENCQKNMNFQKTDQMIRMTKNLDIKVHLTFTFGLSGETKDSIQRTIDYVLNLEPNSVQFSILTPFPGTRLFEELDEQGRILIKDWSKYDGHYHCVFQPDNLPPQDLEMAKRRAYHLWAGHLRKKGGYIKRFRDYLKRYGLRYTLFKTLDYLEFVWMKRKRYLNGED